MEGNPQFSYASLRNALGSTAAILQRVLHGNTPNLTLNPAMSMAGGFGTGINNTVDDGPPRRDRENQMDRSFDSRDNHRSWDDHGRDRERRFSDDYSSREGNSRDNDFDRGDSNRAFFGGLLERPGSARRERDDLRGILDSDRRSGNSGFSNSRRSDDLEFQRADLGSNSEFGGMQQWSDGALSQQLHQQKMDNLQQLQLQLQAQLQQQQQQIMQQMQQHQFQQQIHHQEDITNQCADMQYYPNQDASQPGGLRLSAFERPSCILEPPPPQYKIPPKREKPVGCRTVFIGWLPEAMTKEILNEIFYVCGQIESIKISQTKNKAGKRFAHIRFANREAIDQAVMFASYRVIIGDGADDSKVGRINVDYADSYEDQREHENEERQKAREERHRKQEEIDKLNAIEATPVVYSERSAGDVLDKIKKHVDFESTLNTVVQWFERGECNRRHVNMFYAFLHSTHTHIKRLVKEKQEHQEIVERQRQEQLERARSIRNQCSVVAKVFEAAVKKRSWDHFTKAQRKLITQWREQVEEEIKKSEELQIQNREEVGMELDDELSEDGAGNTAAYQSQPGEIDPTDSQVETQRKSVAQPDAKRARIDSESSTTEGSIEKENEKLRRQVSALKMMAEKNAAMIWQVEGYKNETELVKQQYQSEIRQRDQNITQLSHALQGLQQYLTNVHIKELDMKKPTVSVEVVITEDSNKKESSPEPKKETALKDGNEADTEDSQSTVMEDAAERKRSMKDSEDKEKSVSQSEPKIVEESESKEKYSEASDTSDIVGSKKGMEEQSASAKDEGNVGDDDEETGVKEKRKRRGPRGGRRVKKSAVSKAKVLQERADKNDSTEDSHDVPVSQSSVTEDEVPSAIEKVSDDVSTQSPVENGDKMSTEQDEAGVSGLESSTEPAVFEDVEPSVVRLSNRELALVGVLCSYLHVCRSGATPFEIYSFVQGQCPGVETSTVWKMLKTLPNLFCEFLALDGSQKWTFCGFESISD